MSQRLYLHELETVAKLAGFPDYKSLLQQRYQVECVSLQDLAENLHISQPRLKKHLEKYGIPLRKRGGANNVKIVLTAELIQEIARDGIPAVSMRLGVESSVLYARIRRWISGQTGEDLTPLK